MSDKPVSSQRRKVLRTLSIATALVPLSGLLLRNPAHAQKDRVSEDDPMAKSLNYSHDATKVTSKQRKKDQFCHNCQLLQSGEGDWRPCQVFSSRLVNINGWCSAYTRKA